MIADDRMLPLILQYGVLIAVVLVLLGQLGVPTGVPAELVLLVAGGYTVRSIPELLEGLALIGAADVLGSLILFLLVRRGTTGLVSRVGGARQRGDPRTGGRLRHPRAIFLSRSLPLVRIYGTVGSGLMRTRTRDFLAGSVPAGLLWAGTPLTLGFLFRDHVAGVVAGYPSGVLSIAFVVPGLLLTLVMFRRLRRVAPELPAVASRVEAARGAWIGRRFPTHDLVLQPRPVLLNGSPVPVSSRRPVPPYP